MWSKLLFLLMFVLLSALAVESGDRNIWHEEPNAILPNGQYILQAAEGPKKQFFISYSNRIKNALLKGAFIKGAVTVITSTPPIFFLVSVIQGELMGVPFFDMFAKHLLQLHDTHATVFFVENVGTNGTFFLRTDCAEEVETLYLAGLQLKCGEQEAVPIVAKYGDRYPQEMQIYLQTQPNDRDESKWLTYERSELFGQRNLKFEENERALWKLLRVE